MEEKDCKKRRIEDFDDDKEIRNKFPDFSNSASIIMDLESQLKEEKTITEQLRGDLVESDRKNGELIAFQKNIMEYVQKQMKSVESSILQKIEQRLVPNMHKKFNELKDEFSDNICSLRDDMEQQTENIGDELKQLQNNIKDTEQQSFLLHFGKKFYEFNEEMKHMKMLTTDDRVKEEGNLLLRILDLSKSELKEQGFNVLLDEMLDESMCYAFEMNGSRINVCTNPHWKTYQSKRFGAKFHERFKTFKDLENSSNRAIRLADEATELRKIIEDKSNNGVNNIGFKIIIQQIKQNIIALHGGMVLVSRFGYVEFLKEILKAGPASKLIARECRDAPLHPSHTALFEAANGGHTECVQLLLNGGPSEYRELAVVRCFEE
eukprot:TRINITY_DN6083_c0_g1_i1.p1 TRINITY_DN6083_c0_g1~~TRINITY_DN6083_c0_g1_i1.p1  ORF type:complete len:378 (-),score=98.01 TRINITY_DN6083_c0_g1_i1:80-1213(-)